MDSSDQADRISNLPDVLLVLIISCLSFKECVQTCALSKRWRSVYLATRNVSFKETDFLSPSVNANPIKNALGRIVFIDYVRRWVARIHDQPIDTFGRWRSEKEVKNLVLDFSNPAWRTFQDVNLDELVVEIPQSVYDLATLDSLKVGACKKFDSEKLSNLGKLKTMIPRSEHPHFLRPMEIKHIVLKTELHPREFNGIRLLFINFPNLETVTIDLLPSSPIATASSYAGIDPQTYWMQNISYECQREILKAVIVKNFIGCAKELHIVKFFIRSGCEHLERAEIYMPFDLDNGRKVFAHAKSEMLQRSSNHLQVVVHNS
ncbi:hypothetical protein YC2023_015893 [Brassica napus]